MKTTRVGSNIVVIELTDDEIAEICRRGHRVGETCRVLGEEIISAFSPEEDIGPVYESN